MHPLGVATILSELQIDRSTLVSALLHDVVEDTEISLEEIEEQFGPEVAFLVDGVTKLNQFQYQTKEEQQIENYRKMIFGHGKRCARSGHQARGPITQYAYLKAYAS